MFEVAFRIAGSADRRPTLPGLGLRSSEIRVWNGTSWQPTSQHKGGDRRMCCCAKPRQLWTWLVSETMLFRACGIRWKACFLTGSVQHFTVPTPGPAPRHIPNSSQHALFLLTMAEWAGLTGACFAKHSLHLSECCDKFSHLSSMFASLAGA